mgnify:CR=1 FL=1
MTSREIVKRAIRFQNPPRIAYNFDSNRTPVDGISYGEDMMWVFAAQKPLVDGVNEWGVKYETVDDSFGEPKEFPLEEAEDLEDLENYQFPDFTEDWRYDEMRKQIKENNKEKYVLGMIPHGIFQHMIDMFGFMGFMMNVGGNIEMVEKMADMFCDSAIGVVKKMAECGVDGVITIDDLALQDRLMVSMDVFVEVFKPRFERLYKACHDLGLDTFIHCCGYTLDLIEHLIEAGCDVVNLDQQDNMGMEKLSERYKGRICFYCPIDIQRTLDLDEKGIEERVVQMIQAFATEKGGFIAKTYPQPRAIQMSDEYLKTMTDAFKKHGVVK